MDLSISTVLTCILAAGNAFGAPNDSQKSPGSTDAAWIDLKDEPSRSDLFEAYVIPKTRGPSPIQTRQFDLRGEFSFPRHALYDGNEPRANSIFGIDISHHNGSSFDFGLLRQQEIRFVYMKASQGVRFRDPVFIDHWKAIGVLQQSLAIRRGAYHFLSAQADPVEQANSFLALLDLAGGLKPSDMPPVVDLEWDVARPNTPDRWLGQRPSDIVQKALIWLSHVKAKTGRAPMLYTSLAWWRERGIPESEIAKFSEFPLWIADYSESRRAIERPPTPGGARWHVWQFTDRARLSVGYPANRGIDANIFHGTSDQFITAFDLDKE